MRYYINGKPQETSGSTADARAMLSRAGFGRGYVLATIDSQLCRGQVRLYEGQRFLALRR